KSLSCFFRKAFRSYSHFYAPFACLLLNWFLLFAGWKIRCLENPQRGESTVFREISTFPVWKIHSAENPPYFPEIPPRCFRENLRRPSRPPCTVHNFDLL
ncbi:MAG: hypothetical protein IKY07_02075, partial [Clostridia bacterium]|nr:hypothetical protein [Clostridia bacterium]